MTFIAIILMIIAMLVTAGILFIGVIGMAKGGPFNEKWGNRLMRYRILAQFIALMMFALAVAMLKSGN